MSKNQNDTMGKQGWCFGNFDAGVPACGSCQLAYLCEPSTNRVRSGDLNSTDERFKEVSPLAYLLEALSGKFEHSEDEIEGGKYHSFRDENKNPVVAVASYKDGKIEIQSAGGRIKKKNGFRSIDAVETALAELGING